MKRLVLLAASALVLTGGESATEPNAPSGDMSGTATLDPASGSHQVVDVGGSPIHQVASMNLVPTGYQPFTPSGRVSATQMPPC